jgi:predicted chitinase
MPDSANLITVDRIKAFCPRADDQIVEALVTAAPKALPAAGLDDPVRLAHFMAQIATETGGLRRLDEDLKYTAARLVQVFKSKFKTVAAAAPYAGNPEKLANFVYGGRLGNTKPGDGWLYRGSGLIQLTGRANFEKIGKLVGIGLVGDPELARHADSALEIALGFWTKNKINAVAGTASDAAVKAVTKLVNGGFNGLEDRQAYFRKAIKIFTMAAPPAAQAKPETSKPAAKRQAFAAAAEAPPSGEAQAPAPVSPELSGPQWVSRFPTSRDVDDLEPDFAQCVSSFVSAMRSAGAAVDISATYRPKERAYLMHWCWLIAKGQVDPAKVQPMPGVAIRWDHGSLSRSRAAAKQMVAGYQMAFVAALNSRHTERRAVDMTIQWKGQLSIKKRDGSTATISSQPRNGGNAELVKIGAGYGVIKLVTDPPHWSDDGR